MKNLTLARQYARRIFPLCGAKIEEVLDFFKKVSNFLAASRDFRLFLHHPSFHLPEKKKLVLELYGKPEIPDFILYWVDSLIAKQQMDFVPDIACELQRKYDEECNVQEVGVASAFPLTEEQKQALTKKIFEYTGKKTVLKCSVSEKLIAGYLVRINDRLLDNSIRSEFAELSDRLWTASQT